MIEGCSKRLFPRSASTYLMTFKDDVHGNSKHSTVKGTGWLRQSFTYHFYRLLERHGIRTHLTEDSLLEDGIIVQMMAPVKIEIIVRNISRGHWVDDHKVPLFEGGLRFEPPLVEFCLKLKTGSLDDPRISPELCVHLHKMAKEPIVRGHMLETLEEAATLKQLALQVNHIYGQLVEAAGWILEDFKFEVGVTTDRSFVIIDEISPDCTRIRDKQGNSLTKDLYRQRRSHDDIFEGYQRLTNFVEQAYAERYF